MLMSMRAISSGVAGRPNFGGAGAAADAALATSITTVAIDAMRLDIDIAHLSVAGDAPALDGAEMEVLPRRILRDPIGVRLLNDALLVRGAAHQRRRTAAPHPWKAETRQRLGQHRTGEGRFRPALAAIGGDVDPAHAAQARPGKPGDLVIAGALHVDAEGRLQNHR